MSRGDELDGCLFMKGSGGLLGARHGANPVS